MINKKELSQNIQTIKEIEKEMSLKLSDSEVVDFSLRYLITDKINSSHNGSIQENKVSEKATKGQISYLEGLGYKGDFSILSKQEADKLIKEFLNEPKEDY